MKALAIAFLAAVFYIGSATFPETVKSVGSLFAADRPGILATKDAIGDAYHDMLDFEHSNFKDKGSYINLNGLMAHLMGQRYMNERVKLDNGHLTYLIGEYSPTPAAIQITKLYARQKEKGSGFLFVLAPSQVPKYESLLPAGYADYSNQNADDLLCMLKENGVPVLDLRDAMRDEGIGHSEAFYVTDHHWTMETGFWAYTKIVERLVQAGTVGPIDPEYTSPSGFDIETYPRFFLGSAGKRTGVYYAGVDDFSVINPRFETDISLGIPSIGLSKKGRFQDISFMEGHPRLDYFSSNPYGAFGYGNRDIKEYRNDGSPVDLKAMTIGESFSKAPFTYLPLVFRTCNQLDMRHFDGDFEAYYSSFDPDIVIVLTNAGSVDSSTLAYDYFNDFQNPETASGGFEDSEGSGLG